MSSSCCLKPLSPTCKQHQSEAPLSVPQCAAAQQDLLVVQRVFLTAVRQCPREAVQAVVRGFTADFTWRGKEVTQQVGCVSAFIYRMMFEIFCLCAAFNIFEREEFTGSARTS